MAGPQGVCSVCAKKSPGIVVQIVPGRAEMIVDDVEHDAEAALMRRVDERAQVLRRAVAAIGREGQDAVIAPVPAADEIGDRHDLDAP